MEHRLELLHSSGGKRVRSCAPEDAEGAKGMGYQRGGSAGSASEQETPVLASATPHIHACMISFLEKVYEHDTTVRFPTFACFVQEGVVNKVLTSHVCML